MFFHSKNETKQNNISADAGHFLKKKIHLKDFENENLTTTIRRNNAEQPYFSMKIIQKKVKQTKP